MNISEFEYDNEKLHGRIIELEQTLTNLRVKLKRFEDHEKWISTARQRMTPVVKLI